MNRLVFKESSNFFDMNHLVFKDREKYESIVLQKIQLEDDMMLYTITKEDEVPKLRKKIDYMIFEKNESSRMRTNESQLMDNLCMKLEKISAAAAEMKEANEQLTLQFRESKNSLSLLAGKKENAKVLGNSSNLKVVEGLQKKAEMSSATIYLELLATLFCFSVLEFANGSGNHDILSSVYPEVFEKMFPFEGKLKNSMMLTDDRMKDQRNYVLCNELCNKGNNLCNQK
mmetsp:Transcript_23555/g.53743  ORF Transcript_23555/g.53743 Transcript_23555/m.53743 type:complete len:229 (-) Transcript_23555:785-1471(-)